MKGRNQSNVQNFTHGADEKCKTTYCDICQRNYSSNQAWKKHIFHIHPSFYKKRIIRKTVECNNCSKKYSTQRALIRHIKISHPEEIKAKKYSERVTSTIECSSCNKKFSTRRSLIRHWRHFHNNIILTASKKKTLACDECDKKYSNKFSLYKHQQSHHPNSNKFVERELKKIFECCSCGRKYSYKRALQRHLKLFHPKEFAKTIANKPFVCNVCGKRYSTNNGFTLHMKRFHPENATKNSLSRRQFTSFKCPICQSSFEMKSAILQHFIDGHQINVVPESFEFDRRSNFDEWRAHVEENTKCSYSIGSSYTYRGHRFIIHECNRSGYYQRTSRGVRHTKVKGSRKINAFCPAEIRLRIAPDQRCQVQFTSMHVGHANELIHMRLNNGDRESIAAALTASVPVDSILHKIAVPKSDEPPCTELKRVNIANADDVRNIRKKLAFLSSRTGQNQIRGWSMMSEKAGDRALSNSHAADVETWIKQNVDSLLYANGIGGVDTEEPISHRQDYTFVIMTRAQKEKLAAYGNNVVYFHLICEPPKHSFLLAALLVIVVPNSCEQVPSSRCYACAFVLSNRNGDAELYGLFFRTVLQAVPTLRPRILITPVSDALDRALDQEGSSVARRRLYCVWQVMRVWRRHVSRLVKNGESQKELSDMLKRLLYEPDEDQFVCELDLLKIRLQREKDFGQFFQENYVSCVDRWAYCCAGIDPNMVLEAFHRKFIFSTLSRCYSKNTGDRMGAEDSKRNNALLNLLVRISNLISRQEYEQLVLLERGMTDTKLQDLRYRHRRTAFDFENISVDVSGAQWLVTSSANFSKTNHDRVFLVEKVKNDRCVDCKLVCKPCAACVHQYKCLCIDSRLRKNMCTHIHLVCQFLLHGRSRENAGNAKEKAHNCRRNNGDCAVSSKELISTTPLNNSKKQNCATSAAANRCSDCCDYDVACSADENERKLMLENQLLAEQFVETDYESDLNDSFGMESVEGVDDEVSAED